MTKIDYKYGFPLFTRSLNPITIGSDKIIISDIWSFWDYIVKKKNKDKVFLFSLLQQAKNFYKVAEKSEMKSKPLLYYYSFLNFSKILIHLEQSNPISQKYNHGIGEKNNGNFLHSEIDIFKSGMTRNGNNKSVAYELMAIFGDDISHFNTNNKLTIDLKKYFSHCVGVHRAYSQIYTQYEHFFKLFNEKILKDGKELIFEAEVQCKANEKQELINLGYQIDSNNKIKWSITRNNYHVTINDYFNLSKQIKNSGIWYFIGNHGYTLYISSNQDYRYSPETIICNMMFYLGSITRYHPYLFDRIFSDKEQWLISEFLTTQPKQYLYLATAKYLGQDVLKAYSSF